MASAVEVTSQAQQPTYSLFDANAVAVATLFGSPLAGTSLMALNYRRLGRGRSAMTALFVGIIATGFLLLLGWSLPSSVSAPIGLLFLFGVQRSAKSLQGTAVKEHVEHGGKLGSKWGAFGLGFVFLAALFAVVFLAVKNDPKVTIGSKDEVFYSGSATKEEAQALGNALKTNGYFTDRGVSVFLAKGKDGTIISFVTKEGMWNQPDIVSEFEEVGRQTAPAVGGLPIQVRLINSNKDIKAESTVGSAVFDGGDTIYYVGVATKSQAQALGQVLKTDGYFKGNGADVFLSKHSDGTILSFVVGNGAWNDPNIVADFEKISHHAAPAVGGLPVRLRLINPNLEVKKDELLN